MDLKTARGHLMPHSSICIMDLSALQIIPFLHRNGLARLSILAKKWTHLYGHRVGLRALLQVSLCWHGTDIWTDNGTD